MADIKSRGFVLLADERPLARQGARVSLRKFSGVTITGETGAMSEAIAEATCLRPDIILLDGRLLGGDAEAACREIRRRLPLTRILILSAYLDKHPVAEIAAASQKAGAPYIHVPSAQERRIMEMVAEGLTNKEIGQRLELTEKTIRNYLYKIMKKSGLVRRSQLAACVIRESMFFEGAPLSAENPGCDLTADSDSSMPARKLTRQELRVTALVTEGMTNRQIGAAIGLSEKTVRNYLSRTMNKLQLCRRAQVAAYYARYYSGASAAADIAAVPIMHAAKGEHGSECRQRAN